MTTCQIQWVDKRGVPTPDRNLSIGRVRTIKRVEEVAPYRYYTHDVSEWFHICREHAQRLREPGMHIWEWEPMHLVPCAGCGVFTIGKCGTHGPTCMACCYTGPCRECQVWFPYRELCGACRAGTCTEGRR